MKGYAVRRVLGLLPVLLTAVVLTFVANQFVPGDPITTLLSDRSGDAKLEARLRAEYGLDRPLWRQFGSYVAGILRGDFGLSFRYASTPVIEVIAPGLLVSPLLAGGALLIAVPLGVALGTFASSLVGVDSERRTRTPFLSTGPGRHRAPPIGLGRSCRAPG